MFRVVFFMALLLMPMGVPTLLWAGDSAPNLSANPSQKGPPMVTITTSMGAITIALNREKAPITVENFLSYVDAGFFDGTIFHRVIPHFMIQGGGMTPDMDEKPTNPPIRNEADNGLKNKRGTLAMARTQAQDSATSQFFINLVDNRFLDHGAQGFGYAVFAEVTEGLDVLDKIGAVATGRKHGHDDVPIEPVVIKSARRK